MDRLPPRRDTYLARFENGPLHGTLRRLRSLPSGAPPDFVPLTGSDYGAYALAGDAGSDGTLPYWWIPLSEGTDPARAFAWSPDEKRVPTQPRRGAGRHK